MVSRLDSKGAKESIDVVKGFPHSNEYLVAKFAFDTAGNESSKFAPKSSRIDSVRTNLGRHSRRAEDRFPRHRQLRVVL